MLNKKSQAQQSCWIFFKPKFEQGYGGASRHYPNFSNKKAVLGSIIVTVAEIIAIFIILGLFVGFSYLAPKKAYVGFEEKGNNLSNWGEFYNKNLLSFTLNCESYFHGEMFKFHEVLNKWAIEDVKVIDVRFFIENSDCNLGDLIIINKGSGKMLRCKKNACVVIAEWPDNFGEDSAFLELVPYNLSIYLKEIKK